MQKHAREEEELHRMNLRRFVLHSEGDLKELPEESDRKRFKFSYIDVEKLVSFNIKKRIKELVRESNSERGHRLYVSKEVDETSSSSCEQCESQDEDEDGEDQQLSQNENYEEDMKIEKIKPYLTEFANVVTCNWILRLIESEIKRRLKRSKPSQKRYSSSSSNSSHQSASARPVRRFSLHQLLTSPPPEDDGPETIFLVNLIPNRINLFKKCLYLNQTPNLNHAQFDYFAINLTRAENEKKKDLDVVTSATSFLDDANNTFVKYFRSLNKLVEFRIKDDQHQVNETNGLTIRLTRKSDDKRITLIQNEDQMRFLLKEHLLAPKKCDGNESKVVFVNVDQFQREADVMSLNGKETSTRRNKSPPSPLIFMVGNRIELEEHKITVLLDESFGETNLVRPFISCLRQILYELDKNIVQ